MRFKDITGHKEEIAKLRAMVNSGRIPHAILLHGPSGIGKMSVARAFIQYVFCINRQDGDSCGKCPSCMQTSKHNNPDVHYVYPVIKKSSPSRILSSDYWEEWLEMLSKHPYMAPDKWLKILDAGNSRPLIYVKESEEILRQSSLSSYGNGFKVFVVWLPEKMNIEAANKLLKIIEEPFNDTLFILVSNNPSELLPTIRSRLQSVEFKALPEEEILKFIMQRGKSQDEALSLAKIAGGNMNTLATLMDKDGELTEFRTDFIEVMRACYTRKMPMLKKYADKFAAYGREKSLRLLEYFSRMIRESFISNLKCHSIENMTQEEKQFVSRFGPFINATNVEDMMREVDRTSDDISKNANQKIVWFDFFIECTRLIRTNIPK